MGASASATASAPPGPPGTPPTGRRLAFILGALLLGMLIAALDQTIVATALPTIAGDLHGLSHISWVVTAYLLAETASTPLWGKLGDLYGRKAFFQGAIVIFLVGSALAGLSQSMIQLIGFRGLQGIGAGGLVVGAQAIVGDVVSPRERGRYQGVFGAVFGVASVLGPLLGGYLVDSLSWRWVFYVNLPVGAVALAVTATALPASGPRGRHSVDYAGTVLIAGAATSLVLLTTLGGTSYPWLSAQTAAFGAAAVVLLVGWALVEKRAAEPVLPLHLFKNRIFTATSAIGFVVGFAMFGAITYLPQYLQVVEGVSATSSGLRLLPLMAGLLVTTIAAGNLISRWGRYKVFPVCGTAVMALGLYLLSTVSSTTSTATTSAYMFVLGVGIGGVMQVLVIAVQNAVEYRDLGVATSGATFFRSIGGSFGTAVFGAIFVNRLTANLARDLGGLRVPRGFNPTAGASPAALAKLPPAVHAGFVHVFASSIDTVFLVAVPIAGVAWLLSWTLKEVPLRQAVRAPDPAQSLAPTAQPATRSSADEVARALSAIGRREDRPAIYRRLAEAAGLDLDPRSTWVLLRLDGQDAVDLTELCQRIGVPVAKLRVPLDPLVTAGLVTVSEERRAGAGESAGDPEGALEGDLVGQLEEDDEAVHLVARLTAPGVEAAGRLVEARREGLTRLLGSWSAELDARLAEEIARLASDLLHDPSRRALLLEPAETP